MCVFFFRGASQYEMFQHNKDCALWCSWSPSFIPGNQNYSVNRGFLGCRQTFPPYMINRRRKHRQMGLFLQDHRQQIDVCWGRRFSWVRTDEFNIPRGGRWGLWTGRIVGGSLMDVSFEWLRTEILSSKQQHWMLRINIFITHYTIEYCSDMSRCVGWSSQLDKIEPYRMRFGVFILV